MKYVYSRLSFIYLIMNSYVQYHRNIVLMSYPESYCNFCSMVSEIGETFARQIRFPGLPMAFECYYMYY